MKKDKISFKEWLEEMSRIAPKVAPKIYKNCDPVKCAGEEAWFDYYDNNFTPEEALIEDLSYD